MAKTEKKIKTVAKETVIQESFKEETPKTKARLNKKVFVYAIVLLVVVGLIYFGGKVFFAASVNGQLISRLSVIKDLEKQGGKKTLDTIILRTLINQEAKKRKISVSTGEVDGELSRIESGIISQGATLDALLQQQGMTKNDLIDDVKIQLLVSKMVGDSVNVTNKEIDDYLVSQKAQPSLNSTQPAPELTRDQATATIKQQKLQAKIQTFVADLKAKAKISYFINY